MEINSTYKGLLEAKRQRRRRLNRKKDKTVNYGGESRYLDGIIKSRTPFKPGSVQGTKKGESGYKRKPKHRNNNDY